MAFVCRRVKRPPTSTRLPPENGLRYSGSTARSVPESKSTISPKAFFATSTKKIPNTVRASHSHLRSPSRAAAQAPRNIPAKDASEIFGSASRHRPSQNLLIGSLMPLLNSFVSVRFPLPRRSSFVPWRGRCSLLLELPGARGARRLLSATAKRPVLPRQAGVLQEVLQPCHGPVQGSVS